MMDWRGCGRQRSWWHFNNIPVFTYNKVLLWDLPGRTLCKTTTYFSRKSAASLQPGIVRTRSI